MIINSKILYTKHSTEDNFELSEVNTYMNELFSEIFLGFAAKDRYTIAESVLYHLENYGVKVWYDRHDLIIGDNRQIKNFEEGILNKKYAILIFSENTEPCVCYNEEIDVVYGLYRENKIKIFPILYNVIYDDLPPRYQWVKEIIYREVSDQSGTLNVVSSIMCRYLLDILKTLPIKSFKSVLKICPATKEFDFIKHMIEQYESIHHHNFNSRLTALYSVYHFIKLYHFPKIELYIIPQKSIEWIFSLTKLDLKVDFKELRIAEYCILILLNFILSH